MIRFLVCSPRLLLRNFIDIIFVELRIFRPVFFFLFDDLRDQFSPGAWLDLRERNRQLLVKVAGGKITMVRQVVLDNAPYHNVLVEDAVPTLQSRKEQLCAWLTRNAIPWTPDMLKPELYALCKKFAPAPTFRLDQ